MRRVVVTCLIIFSAITLSMVGGASDQRTRGVGAAVTRTPTQVEVTNFPAVQAVAGTVQVGNFPAVQGVVGSVAIGNFPLDGQGNLRVSGLVASVAPSSFQQIADGLNVSPGTQVFLGPFPVAGWRQYTLFVRAALPTTGNVYCSSPLVEEGAPGVSVFMSPTINQAVGYPCTDTLTQVPVEIVERAEHGDVIAPEMRVRLDAADVFPTSLRFDAWLYLSN